MYLVFLVHQYNLYCPFSPSSHLSHTHILVILYSHSSLPLHTSATSPHSHVDVVLLYCVRKKNTLSYCKVSVQRCIANSCISSQTAASSPSGSPHHIHNTPFHARWLSPQLLSSINQTVFELINNKSISRRREMRVSGGQCLFVRQTSAALALSAMELGVPFTLKTCGYLAIINLNINYK